MANYTVIISLSLAPKQVHLYMLCHQGLSGPDDHGLRYSQSQPLLGRGTTASCPTKVQWE